jgi:hypothetical protein
VPQYLLAGVGLWLMYYSWRGVFPKSPLNKVALTKPMPLRSRFLFGSFELFLFYLGIVLASANK